MVHVSVIGTGNMGSALIRGLSLDGTHRVTAHDVDETALEAVADYAETTTDLAVASEAPVVVLAVKPDTVPAVLADLDLAADQTLVSFAAGVPLAYLRDRTDAAVLRVMPNLAAETGDMAAAVAPPEVPDEVDAVLSAVGEYAGIEESAMDVATAVNGSGPAFVFYLLGAMAEAGVESGLTEEQAETLAAQTFRGAAETVKRSDRSVEELIDAVCSPGGTTIEGMEVLWDSDADEALVEAVRAAEDRSAELAGEVEE